MGFIRSGGRCSLRFYIAEPIPRLRAIENCECFVEVACYPTGDGGSQKTKPNMKQHIKFAVIIALAGSSLSALGQIVAQWNFQDLPSALSSTGVRYPATGGIAASTGTGSAFGLHASASSVFSSPTGNGSTRSFSANTWGLGDYFQFQTSTVGFSGTHLTISFGQVRSGTGPTGFQLSYSTDGTTFSPIGSAYTVANNSSPNNWSAGTFNAGTVFNFDTTGIAGGLLGVTDVYFRLSATTLGSSTGGTSRVDDFTITAVPEPYEYAAMSAAGLIGFALWRRRAAN
jgi:hypothetical protein